MTPNNLPDICGCQQVVEFTLVDSKEPVPRDESSRPEDLKDLIMVRVNHPKFEVFIIFKPLKTIIFLNLPDLSVGPLNTESKGPKHLKVSH